jgi:hypothetical protein
MPAALVPDDRIPELAAHLESPATLQVLRHLREAGFLLNGADLAPETAAVLRRLTDLGLVDAGSDGSTHGMPFIWVSNGNGERVLKYLAASPSAAQTTPESTGGLVGGQPPIISARTLLDLAVWCRQRLGSTDGASAGPTTAAAAKPASAPKKRRKGKP